MPKRWVWLQLIVGWLPVWALYSLLIVTAHPGTSLHSAFYAGMRAIGCAAVLGLAVHRLTERVAWPVPMRLSFVGVHLLSATAFSMAWMLLTTTFENLLVLPYGGTLQVLIRGPIVGFLVIGVWLYVMVAAVTYATQAAQRVVLAESLAASSQLAALRTQLNPHFLFNALHTVVQLIPRDPSRATRAAELLAALLRTSLEETRDLVPLREEWSFVQRYLDVELIRFGERLQVYMTLPAECADVPVPSFALQTLVENAVRHGATPQVDATTLHVEAHATDGLLTLSVRDNGIGFSADATTSGTGLRRLRERLRALYGENGSLSVTSSPQQGTAATLRVPARLDSDT